MFLHNYLYRLKCIVRDKQMVFWIFLFPLLISTLFNLAFINLLNAENFSKIKIGIVDNAEYRKDTGFMIAIDAVSNSDKKTGKDNLFEITYTSKDEADKLLEDSKVEGYIYLNNGIQLIVKETGINQTIIKAFLDDFMQSSSTIATIIRQKPVAIEEGLLDSISERADYLKEIPAGKSPPDTIVNYFYALIAMTCLYGGLLGIKEVTSIQANLSPEGARVNIAPAHKMRMFIASMFAAVTVQLTVIFALLGYLILVLKINFGNQLGFVVLTCIIATITGVTFGTCIAAIIKKEEGVKIGILVGLTMLMSFLAGMMYDKMKYIVAIKFPVLAYLNPANLITDSFYSLYFYNTHEQFFTNIALLCVFSAVFSIITYTVLRRQAYANL